MIGGKGGPTDPLGDRGTCGLRLGKCVATRRGACRQKGPLPLLAQRGFPIFPAPLQTVGVPRFSSDMVLEGGSVHVDGEGCAGLGRVGPACLRLRRRREGDCARRA